MAHPDIPGPAMALEHAAWTDVVKEWRALLPVDMNSKQADPLVRAIEAWGETLVMLRRTQSDDVVRAAFEIRNKGYREVST